MRNLKLTTLINILLGLYIFIWGYYMIFNWDVYAIKLNTNLGFSVVTGFPIVVLSLTGLLALIIARIYAQFIRLYNERTLRERSYRAKMLEKELQIIRMKYDSQNSPDTAWEEELKEIKARLSQLTSGMEERQNISDPVKSEPGKEEKNPEENT